MAARRLMRRLRCFYAGYIFELGRLCKVRVRVVFSAVVYFRRFYVNRSFCEEDPRHIAPACLYLASKVEECPVQAKLINIFAKRIAQHAQQNGHWEGSGNNGVGTSDGADGTNPTSTPGGVAPTPSLTAAPTPPSATAAAAPMPNAASTPSTAPSGREVLGASELLYAPATVNDVLRSEVVVLKQLDAYLIVHHPLHALPSYLEELGVSSDSDAALRIYGIVSDAYRCDICLMEPPHILALGAAFLASSAACGSGSAAWVRAADGTSPASDVDTEALVAVMERFEALDGITTDDVVPFARHMLDYYAGDAEAIRSRGCRDELARALSAVLAAPAVSVP